MILPQKVPQAAARPQPHNFGPGALLSCLFPEPTPVGNQASGHIPGAHLPQRAGQADPGLRPGLHRGALGTYCCPSYVQLRPRFLLKQQEGLGPCPPNPLHMKQACCGACGPAVQFLWRSWVPTTFPPTSSYVAQCLLSRRSGKKQIEPGHVLPWTTCPCPLASQPTEQPYAETTSLRDHPDLRRPAPCELHLKDTGSAAS